jgi:hypothetical protein
MADVFLSYKREDAPKVQHLVQLLRADGFSVWWDFEIAPDAPWEETIERELEAAANVIVVWSQKSVVSENVKAEARRARQKGNLQQVYIEACTPPLFFGERQGVDLRSLQSNSDANFRSLVAALRVMQTATPASSKEAVLLGRRDLLSLTTEADAIAAVDEAAVIAEKLISDFVWESLQTAVQIEKQLAKSDDLSGGYGSEYATFRLRRLEQKVAEELVRGLDGSLLEKRASGVVGDLRKKLSLIGLDFDLAVVRIRDRLQAHSTSRLDSNAATRLPETLNGFGSRLFFAHIPAVGGAHSVWSAMASSFIGDSIGHDGVLFMLCLMGPGSMSENISSHFAQRLNDQRFRGEINQWVRDNLVQNFDVLRSSLRSEIAAMIAQESQYLL